jgi:hypothetical protein
MASQITESTPGSSFQTLQTIDSEYQSDTNSDNLETPSILSTSNLRKRKRLKQRHPAWDHARKPILGLESVKTSKDKGLRRIWYCRYPKCEQYSCLSTKAAGHHLSTIHAITLKEEPSKVNKAIDNDIKSIFSRQTLSNKDIQHQRERETLLQVVNRSDVHQSLLRLIVHHDMPLSTVEWPELHTFVFSINYMAAGCIWTTHQTTANHIERTFFKRRQQVTQLLQQS